jgi:hypothetical protein
MLLERVPLGTPIQVAFQREAFLKTGGWNSELDVNSDDSDSWIRIAQYGDVVFVNECLAYRTIWPGAYNYRVSLRERLETNMLMKQRIYPLIHSKYTDSVPTLQQVYAYLKLHWSFVAFKNFKLIEGLRLAFPSGFSPTAWRLLIQAVQFRRYQTAHPQIRNQVIAQVAAADVTPQKMAKPLHL